MRSPTSFLIIATVLFLLTSVPITVSDATASYDSPDGMYTYITHGSGAESDPYWSEIASLSCGSDTVFLQSSLEGYGVTTVTSLSGCGADTVVVPRTVTSVADGALDGTEVERMVFLGDRPEMSIPNRVEVIALDSTSGWDAHTETIPLRTFGDGGSAFTYYVLEGSAYVYGASGPTDITIPDTDDDGVPFVGIDSEAFRDGDITSISFGRNLVSVGTRAFYGCESLASVTMGGSVRDIRDEAFRYCVRLADVDLTGVVTIGFESFRDCRSFGTITVPDSVTIMGGGAFYLCRSARSVDVGSGIDALSERSFGYCSSLESVDITGITSLGTSAFISCTSLRHVILDGDITDIGDSAFSGCTYLTGLDLGGSLVTVGGGAFYECRLLSELTFPGTLETIGTKAFFHCYGLTDLYFEGDMPEMSGDLLFGTADVAVHIYDTHKGSWASFDGELIVEEGPGTARMPSASVVIAVILAVAVLAVAVFVHRKVR